MNKNSGKTLETPLAVVFGGHSPIAMACVRHLAEVQDVILVSRKIDFMLQEAFRSCPRVFLKELDLEVSGQARSLIIQILDEGKNINAIVFLQRYRPKNEPLFEAHCAVELWSIKDVLEAMGEREADGRTVHVLISSSPAASKVLIDQDFHYHLVKSGQEALVRYFSVSLARLGICVNAIRIGSIVIKPRAASYWNSIPNVVENLKNIAPSGTLQSSDTVGAAFATLALVNAAGFTGQIFTIDDGFDLRDSAQIAKSSLED
jgi:enoyl-[acyl-carrier-protein] reductase (NADH)